MNTGNSLNFDAAGLQNAQEEEFRKEEEQQQNELKQLLANAFDDLIDDDDDEYSITSDEGTASSANVSLHHKGKGDRDTPLQDIKSSDDFSLQDNWGQGGFPTSTPMVLPSQQPTFSERQEQDGVSSNRNSQENPLRSSQELVVRGSYDALRSSQDMPLRSSMDMALRSSQDMPLRSSQDMGLRMSQDMPLRSSQDIGLRSSQDNALRSSQDVPLRASQEYGIRGVQEPHRALQEYPAGTGDGLHSDGYHSNSEQDSMTPTFAQQQNINPQNFDWISQASGQYQTQDMQNIPHQPPPHEVQNVYISYQPQHEPDHIPRNHFNLPDRQETEGGNVPETNYLPHYQQPPQPQPHPGYYTPSYQQENPPGNHGNFEAYSSLPHSQGYQMGMLGDQQEAYVTPSLPETLQGRDTENFTHDRGQPKVPRLQISPRKPEYSEDYKVQYRRHDKADESDEESYPARQDRPKAEERTQEDMTDPRQYAQLQVLYKARGRKLEELGNEFEILKQETAREIRILKHQLSVAKGEKEGSSSSLQQAQDLLVMAKEDNSNLTGKLRATEAEVEALKRGKEEIMKKLQTAESTIETLNQQLLELGNSESLSRARHEHEVVVGGIQQKHNKEIQVLNEKNDMLNGKINEMNLENTSLRQKLAESYKSAEHAHISRAETINKLTRSLEDSQKQCQTLLESTSSQELSQLRITLQQTIASRKISDDLCMTYQEELKDLKEQLTMLESASALGVLTGVGVSSQQIGCHDDSLLELGIKKTLDFETPDTTASSLGQKTSEFPSGSGDTVTALKAELERCLLSNKQKRLQVTQLREDLKNSQAETEDLKIRCDRAEKSAEQYKNLGISPSNTKNLEWEDLTRTGGQQSAVETRLKKDIHNLRKERDILMEDNDDLKKRLEELGTESERLSEINQDLNKQISDMVKEYDDDKREALDRLQKNCEAIHEIAKDQLREEFQKEAAEEQAKLMDKYEQDCTRLRNELNSTIRELDEVKELYVRVCAEKDNMEDSLKVTLEANMAEKVEQLRKQLKTEKEEEILRYKQNLGIQEDVLRSSLRDELKVELDTEHKQTLETKVAIAKVEWFEEQRQSKMAAVENAVKLIEGEWKVKLETAVEEQVERRVEEAKSDWLAQKKLSFDSELQQQIHKHTTDTESKLQSEFSQHLQKEKEEWLRTSQEEVKRAVEKERTRVTAKAELDLEATLTKEQEKWQKKMDIKLKEVRNSWEEANEVETLKKLEEALEETQKVWEEESEKDLAQKLKEARKDWETTMEVDLLEKLQKEKEKWDANKQHEIQQRIEEAKQQWKSVESEHVEEVRKSLRESWDTEFVDRLKEEKDKWKHSVQLEKTEEVRKVLEQAQREWDTQHDTSIEQIKHDMEENIQDRISAEVSIAVDDARKEWNREHECKLSETMSSAELTQSILKDEIEELKSEMTRLQTELRQKEERWKKDRLDIITNKDAEHKKALKEIQDQFDRDHESVIADQHDRLTKALKSAREQHHKEKAEVELQYMEELQSLREKEAQLQEILRQASESQSEGSSNKFIEKERELWEKEKLQLQQKIEERDDLLENADIHLSQEVDKIRSELEMAYRQRLEEEILNNQQINKSTKQLPSDEEVLQFEAEIKRLGEEKNSLTVENQNLITENEAISNENKRAQTVIKDLKQEIMTKQDDVDKVKNEIQKFKVKMMEDENNYHNQLQTLNSKIVQQTKRLAELEAKEAELTFFKQNCENLQEKHEDYEKDRAEFTETISKLQKEISRLKSEVENYQVQVLQQETQVERWRSETEKQQEQMDQLHKEVTTYRTELEKSESLVDKQQTVVEKLKSEINKYKTRFEKQQMDLERYCGEIERGHKEVSNLQQEVERMRDERNKLAENINNMEAAYKKDLSSQKQKQEEVNARLQRAEKNLKDARQHYKSEMEKMRKSLELENNVAMETMKNKMVEMQKGHLLAMESLRKQYKSELSDVNKKLRAKTEVNSAEVQTDSEDVEDEDDGYMDLRQQYLVTVSKIKDDVMKHITETNLRAAETVRCEMLQERNTTLQELKKIYMENVRKILQNEILEANIEAKLADIEQALEVISFDNQGSRPETPGSSRSSTPTPRSDNKPGDDSMSSLNTSINTSVNRTLSSQPVSNGHMDSAQDRPSSGGRTRSLPPKDTRVAHKPHRERSVSKGVTFSKHLEDKHNRAKSLPGERMSADRYVTFRSPSPKDLSSSGDNSDSEYYSRINGKDDLLPSRFVTPSRSVISKGEKEFHAFSPRPAETSKVLGSSPLYKTVSEPELTANIAHPRYRDFMRSNYKYTSLRDGLGKSPSPTKENSVSSEDLRSFNLPYSNLEQKKSYSVEVDLQSLGLTRTSPRRYNPSPERLNTSASHDAGESPLGTPRTFSRARVHRTTASTGVIDLDDLKLSSLDFDKPASAYRYKVPVKNLVEKFQKIGYDTTDYHTRSSYD